MQIKATTFDLAFNPFAQPEEVQSGLAVGGPTKFLFSVLSAECY